MSTRPAPAFSGHETFALRGGWLKKAYDLLTDHPDLFAREDAFVLLGVGKNMAQSIRFWGRACGVFERYPSGDYSATPLGRALLDDDGWDPYLVTPAARWLLHWQVAARPEAAFTWYYTFNLLRAGDFTPVRLGDQIQTYAADYGWKVPSVSTISRDVECMLHCYTPPDQRRLVTAIEDALACPLSSLGLVRPLPGQRSYYLAAGAQPSLPDALVAWAVLGLIEVGSQRTAAFTDLAYAPGSPGRVFRLDEDGLLARLLGLGELTDGQLVYNDQAGIRQVYWTGDNATALAAVLLARAFEDA